MTDRFLVTGAAGCLGAWTLAALRDQAIEAVAFDLADDRRRLRLVEQPEIVDSQPWVVGDIRDLATLADAVAAHGITHVVHLAALQVPFCRADPIAGSQVNVTGTVNVFEAARRSAGQVRNVVYASSVAVFGPAALYGGGAVRDDERQAPSTLYGVFKQANEATARVYFDDWGVTSVGLRPSVIYGPGRDQGLTSTPTVAMLRAAAGRSTHIEFSGSSTYHHASDVARVMIAAACAPGTGARVHNIGGTDADIAQIAAAIEAEAPGVSVTHGGDPLALPSRLDGAALADWLGDAVRFRPLEEGVADTVARFRRLLEAGLLAVE